MAALSTSNERTSGARERHERSARGSVNAIRRTWPRLTASGASSRSTLARSCQHDDRARTDPRAPRPEASMAIAAACPTSSGASVRSRSTLGRSCEHDGRAEPGRLSAMRGRRWRRGSQRRSHPACPASSGALFARALRWAGRSSTMAEQGPTVAPEAGGIDGDRSCVPHLVRSLCSPALYAGPVVRAR